MKATHPEIINVFSDFFKFEKERPEIEYFVGVFQSLQEIIKEKKAKKSRLLIKEIPSDLQFYVNTKNLFYELSSKYGTKKFVNVEFHLQLGMWYWNYFNYNGKDYIEYDHLDRLTRYKETKGKLWGDVRAAMYDYWLELKGTQELAFFSQLDILKSSILLCGARSKIYGELNKFVKIVSEQIGIQVGNLDELQPLLEALQAAQLNTIDQLLISLYYIG